MEYNKMRCPTCGAGQAWAAECRRCRCDLSLVVGVLRQRYLAHQECLRALRGNDHQRAREAALRCWELSPDKESQRLLAVTFLLQGRHQASLDISELNLH